MVNDSALASSIKSVLAIGQRMSAAGGAAIVGANLSRPLSPDLREAILAAFHKHHILVFPDQDLTKEEQLRFTEQFGEIKEHVGRHSRRIDMASFALSPISARTASRRRNSANQATTVGTPTSRTTRRRR